MMGVLYREEYIIKFSTEKMVQLIYLVLPSSQFMAWQLSTK